MCGGGGGGRGGAQWFSRLSSLFSLSLPTEMPSQRAVKVVIISNLGQRQKSA